MASYALKDIIQIADRAYPDGLVGRADRKEKVGDGLATFIASELKETFDSDASALDQVREALRALNVARREVEAVAEAFSNVEADLESKG